MTKRTPEQRARKGRAIARWAAALRVPSEPSPDVARLLESPALDALAAALAPWFHADRHGDLSDVACGAREYAAEQMAVQALAIAQGLGVQPGGPMRLPVVPRGGR